MKTEHIIALITIAIAVVFVIVTRFYSKSRFLENNKIIFYSVVYALILGYLAWHFYTRGIMMGIVAVGLGGLAIIKYLFDMAKHEKKE